MGGGGWRVNLPKFGCAKFRHLSNERLDRDLCESERRFISMHRGQCAGCAATERNSTFALNMLRGASIEVEVQPNFDERVIRRVKVQRVKEGFRYWSPAIAAACITCLTLFAGLSLVTKPVNIQSAHLPGSEARRIQSPRLTLPTLRLSEPPHFNR